MKRSLIRSCIIAFWILLIATALYLPKWKVIRYEENSINIFAWGDIFDPAIITAFEKETGIKVHLNYYASNEELLVKVKATRGVGYDLIVPSDYVVPLLAEEGLLKELNRSKLTFFNQLNPLLLNHSFDPGNRFSVPFEWEVFGLGVDMAYFEKRPLELSWRLIFDPKIVDYKIAMINDPVETLLISAYYLYGPVDKITPPQVEEVKNLLIMQKSWVEAYADFRGDYFLATKNCPIVVASSSYIWRTMRKFPFVGFIVPKEGTFISVENVSIPKASHKEELVYRFLNYLYRPESIAAHYNTYGFFPATVNAVDLLNLDPVAKSLILSSEEEFKHFYFTKVLLPQQEVRDLWVEVKSESIE